MSDPVLPPDPPGAAVPADPIDPAFERQLTAALHDHARTITGPGDPAALTARLVRHDKHMALRRAGLAGGAVVLLLASLLVFAVSRQDSRVIAADGPSVTAATPGRTALGDPAVPGDSTAAPTVAGPAGSGVSIPLPGEVGPDGSTSTTTGPTATPGGVTTSALPVTPSTTRPGSPPTPVGPGPSTTANAPSPNPTTAPTVAPTAPTTSGPRPTSPSTAPTTIDPGRRCSAHQVNTVLRQTASAAGGLFADFDEGLAPPGSTLSVSSDDISTRRLILSSTKVANADGTWAWSIRWNASGTPRGVDLHFYIECSNGTRLPFTVRRAI